MRGNGFRVLIAGLACGAAAGFAALFSAGEAAADNVCSAVDNHRVERAVGQSHCIANAGPGSRADARDTSGSGAAIAVSSERGAATSLNLAAGSQALSSGVRGGDAWSISTGPKATSVAMARDGGTAIAVAGWGGAAYVGPDGIDCGGGYGFAYESNTGRLCLKAGGVVIR